jgi:hypothetical protein
VEQGRLFLGALIALAIPAVAADPAAAATKLPDPARYAPEVRLAQDEKLYPVRPEGFIAHSDLVWYGCRRGETHREAGVDPARLGAGAADPYRSSRYWRETEGQPEPGCPGAEALPSRTITFGADEWTRPNGGPAGRTARPVPLFAHPANGFALDLRNELRPGNHDLSRVPVTYERGRIGGGWWITYWLLYGYNERGRSQHEGDWERISLRFDARARPKRIAYYAHSGRPRICTFDEVEHVGSRHPVVFSALGSHASYPRPGEFSIGAGGGTDDADDDGEHWRTWVSGLRSPKVDWYGFGGAWGERGSNSTTTGPPGPGQRTAHDWDTGRRKRCDKP